MISEVKAKQISILIALFSINIIHPQTLPKILMDKKVITKNYLPDFSYASYHNGEKQLPLRMIPSLYNYQLKNRMPSK
ncbi:hypothetical protein [Spongiivirga citrea]|uniref:Uncharacterized protein n=1 Tax=Spongiivirga citrea TaxID=1481457 RepID=A0A6M0CPQ7_9FLAO|nr:hypothetical protein [Spongiivirga citrea]NER17849.1 hypothetical protein [Spongiivirga citrea]